MSEEVSTYKRSRLQPNFVCAAVYLNFIVQADEHGMIHVYEVSESFSLRFLFGRPLDICPSDTVKRIAIAHVGNQVHFFVQYGKCIICEFKGVTTVKWGTDLEILDFYVTFKGKLVIMYEGYIMNSLGQTHPLRTHPSHQINHFFEQQDDVVGIMQFDKYREVCDITIWQLGVENKAAHYQCLPGRDVRDVFIFEGIMYEVYDDCIISYPDCKKLSDCKSKRKFRNFKGRVVLCRRDAKHLVLVCQTNRLQTEDGSKNGENRTVDSITENPVAELKDVFYVIDENDFSNGDVYLDSPVFLKSKPNRVRVSDAGFLFQFENGVPLWYRYVKKTTKLHDKYKCTTDTKLGTLRVNQELMNLIKTSNPPHSAFDIKSNGDVYQSTDDTRFFQFPKDTAQVIPFSYKQNKFVVLDHSGQSTMVSF